MIVLLISSSNVTANQEIEIINIDSVIGSFSEEIGNFREDAREWYDNAYFYYMHDAVFNTTIPHLSTVKIETTNETFSKALANPTFHIYDDYQTLNTKEFCESSIDSLSFTEKLVDSKGLFQEQWDNNLNYLDVIPGDVPLYFQSFFQVYEERATPQDNVTVQLEVFPPIESSMDFNSTATYDVGEGLQRVSLQGDYLLQPNSSIIIESDFNPDTFFKGHVTLALHDKRNETILWVGEHKTWEANFTRTFFNDGQSALEVEVFMYLSDFSFNTDYDLTVNIFDKEFEEEQFDIEAVEDRSCSYWLDGFEITGQDELDTWSTSESTSNTLTDLTGNGDESILPGFEIAVSSFILVAIIFVKKFNYLRMKYD